MGRRQTIHIPGVSHSAPIPFGARVGNVVYSSGIRGDNADTGKLSEDVEEQARQCFRNMRTFLEHAGATPDDVVRLTCYLQDFNDRGAINGPWLEMWPNENDRPARHTSKYDPPPGGMKVQIEVIAVVED
jgi:2-iminobutanoate/2-iminopropanoate deaminase